MPKTRRGRILWKVPSRGRGTCPVCLTTRIKLLYTKTKSDGSQLNVCKGCSKAPVERINKGISEASHLSFRRVHRKPFNILVQQQLYSL